LNNASEDQRPAVSPRGKTKPGALVAGPAGGSVWNQALVVIAMAVTGLVVAMFLVAYQVVSSGNTAHRATQTKILTDQYAGFFNGRLASLEAQVRAVAEAPETSAAFDSGDRATLARTATSLNALLAFANNVQLIPAGEAAVNNDIGIGYVAFDVIERAETQPYVGPDGIGGERPQLFVAHSVLNEGVVAGVVFVEVSTDYFLAPLSLFDGSLGQVRIEQRLETGPTITLLNWGDSGSGTDAPPVQMNAPQWSLIFTPNPARIVAVSSTTDMLPGFAAALGLVLGGVALGFANLNRKLENDVRSLVAYTGRALQSPRASPGTFRLSLFRQAAAEIGQLGGPAESKPEADSSTPATPNTAAGKARALPGSTALGASAAPAEANSDTAATPAADDDLLSPSEASAASSPEGDFLEVGPPRKEDDNFGIEVSEDVGPLDLGLQLAPEIFRAYDIRGITTTNLTEDVVYWIGWAFAAEALEREQARVAVGRDGRHSSAGLANALSRGLVDGGVDVLDIGQVPTPLLYFATHALDTGTGVMITGSHNPPEYNGLKMVIAGETLAEARIQNLRRRIEENLLSQGAGDLEQVQLTDHYVEQVLEDVVVARPLKVVVDCGNGVAGSIAPSLIEQLGCEVVPLYCDVNGDFPNHHPDPAEPENLEDLITVVAAEGADLGLAFDGDGDRLGLVTGSGAIVYPDKMLMLFAQDIVGRNPGADIIYDVKCSKHLNGIISELGGRPIMWKTGHSHMKAKLKDTGALLAGEFSGHICFGERWYGFDDALYSAARLLEIIGASDQTVDELFSRFPVTFSTPELKITTTETEKFHIMDRLTKEANFGDGTLTTIDGVRVDYVDGWGLIRSSNTSPVLTLRFEADSQDALSRIQDLFQAQLNAIDPKLTFR